MRHQKNRVSKNRCQTHRASLTPKVTARAREKNSPNAARQSQIFVVVFLGSANPDAYRLPCASVDEAIDLIWSHSSRYKRRLPIDRLFTDVDVRPASAPKLATTEVFSGHTFLSYFRLYPFTLAVLIDGKFVSLSDLEGIWQAKFDLWMHNVERRRERDDQVERRLLARRHNIDLIKSDWSCVEDGLDWHGEPAVSFKARSHYRSPQTKQEKTKNQGVLAEWRAIEDEVGLELPNIIRAKRLGLPGSWDDIAVSAWDSQNSWKHHSRRRHQWRPKGVINS